MYKWLIAKRKIENLLMYPLILIGRFIALIYPSKKQYRIFFFFPFYHIGGAEKVHAQIAKAIGSEDAIIFFTKRSQNDHFLHEFASLSCTIKDISKYTDNKWLYFLNIIYRGIITGYINRQPVAPIVFNGQSNFGYKISPWISRYITQIELIHALNTFSYIRIPFIEFYQQSVTVSNEIILKHKNIYSEYKVPFSWLTKFTFITSRINLPPDRLAEKEIPTQITLLYVGRSSFEKRPHIAAAVARRLKLQGLPVRIDFAGDVEEKIPAKDRPYCNFLGEISDEKKLRNAYLQSQILLIPSSSESGPLVFMEAMANGLAIISTPVGYIPSHIINSVSGFVTNNLEDEEALAKEMTEYVSVLLNDRDMLKSICQFNINYAYNNFDQKHFENDYKKLIQSFS